MSNRILNVKETITTIEMLSPPMFITKSNAINDIKTLKSSTKNSTATIKLRTAISLITVYTFDGNSSCSNFKGESNH